MLDDLRSSIDEGDWTGVDEGTISFARDAVCVLLNTDEAVDAREDVKVVKTEGSATEASGT